MWKMTWRELAACIGGVTAARFLGRRFPEVARTIDYIALAVAVVLIVSFVFVHRRRSPGT
ncbi:MAG TPA: hypothetical protein PLP17_12925 [Oligoflexia bacterium]|nr:hypothetical protein [Oligoflexia bacterium]